MQFKNEQPAYLESLQRESVLPQSTYGLLFLATALGALIAGLLLPKWTPGLVDSLLGSEPKAYWYLARASALVAYAWLWLSMALGLMITNKMARLWPGGPFAIDLHEFASLMGLLFALFHGLILLGDRYINFQLLEILLPFASVRFRPVAVGAGQVAFYGWLVVAFSFYSRKLIGSRAWRLIHFGSFLTYALALLHAVTAGTDTPWPAVQAFYWVSGSALLWLLLYRLLEKKFTSRRPDIIKT